MAKPQYASLTAGLLARKGEAEPAAVELANHGVNLTPEEEAKGVVPAEEKGSDRKPKLSTVAARRIPQLMDPVWEKKHQKALEEEQPVEPFPDSVHELEDADIRKRVEMIRAELGKGSLVEAQPQEEPPKKPAAKKQTPQKPTPKNAQPVCDNLKKTKTQANKRTKKIARAAVTMRLDPERYLAMKLVGAKLSRTNQSILLDALDMYMKSLTENELSDCNCLKKIIMESFDHA